MSTMFGNNQVNNVKENTYLILIDMQRFLYKLIALYRHTKIINISGSYTYNAN